MKPKPDLVTFIATKQANSAVRGPTARYLVYTDPNDPNEDVSHPTLERSIAAQLVKQGVGHIEGEGPDDEREEDEAEEELTGADDTRLIDQAGGNQGAAAARRLRRTVGADNVATGVSGADSRETSAFAIAPAIAGGTAGGGTGEGGDDADAPPAGGEAAAKPKRVRNRTKAGTGAKAPAAKKPAAAKAPAAPKPAAQPEPGTAGGGTGEGGEQQQDADAP